MFSGLLLSVRYLTEDTPVDPKARSHRTSLRLNSDFLTVTKLNVTVTPVNSTSLTMTTLRKLEFIY